MKGSFNINGKEKTLTFEPGSVLMDVLRENGFTEVKEGCREGGCGSCVIILNARLVHACQVFTASAIGKQITTVKGVGDIHNPHPIQTAFAESGAVQCGFCTPGKVLATYSLLSKNPDPTEDQIKNALNGIMCRCTGYVKIIDGVKLAARRMKENG